MNFVQFDYCNPPGTMLYYNHSKDRTLTSE